MSPESSLTCEIEPGPALALEIEPEEPATTDAASLVEVLGADVPLPALIRFVPDVALREVAGAAARYAVGLDVTGQDGLTRADQALTAVRSAQKAITEHFAEPTEIAHRLHKRLTSIRSEWLAEGDAATKVVGERVWRETRRLDAIAAEERRQAQAEADRQAREAARRDAEAAAAAQAPAIIVEDLRRQAETVTAPPVPEPASTPVLRGTASVTTWKARPMGTTGDSDPNPEIADMTPAQRARVVELLRAILADAAPVQAVAINWSYLNARAKADKATFRVPGFEAFEVGGVRAKATSRGGR